MDLFVSEKMDYLVLLQNGLAVLFIIAFFWTLIKYMWSFVKIEKEPVKVLVTGAAGMLNLIFHLVFLVPC
jgi:malate dehydrogenase